MKKIYKLSALFVVVVVVVVNDDVFFLIIFSALISLFLLCRVVHFA